MNSHNTVQSQDPNSIDTTLLTTGPLLTVKELAFELRHHNSFVYQMRQAGFRMPGNRTTLAAALDWLDRNPHWRKRL